MKYTLRSLSDRVFCAEFDNKFDLAMTFWRCQEFYESSSGLFRGRSFTLVDYMRWYSEVHGDGSFTYPSDWSGFNLPSRVITACFRKGIQDQSKYDRAMRTLYRTCKDRAPQFYLIGIMRGDDKTIAHELAHANWSLNSEYRREMQHRLNNIPKRVSAALASRLLNMGYTKSVIQDEMQAYLSTGLAEELGSVKIPNSLIKSFKAMHRKYVP